MNNPIHQPKHILLVEDDPLDVELTRAALAEARLNTHLSVVEDGEMALDFLYRRNRFADRSGPDPSFVLLDLKMPKVNGLDLLLILKADEYLKLIPIVILSSSGERQDVSESYQRGASAYVVKPVDFHEFMEAVGQLGTFWATVNQPLPTPAPRPTPTPSRRLLSNPQLTSKRIGHALSLGFQGNVTESTQL